MPYEDPTHNRIIELLGGPERAVKIIESENTDRQRRWAQDVELIGRILRAHLYVEHYLTQYIQSNNPSLGPVLDAKLSFEQKLHLIDRRGNVSMLRGGIKHINKVRNRLAHNLSAVLTKADSTVFFKDSFFRSHVSEKELGTIDSPPIEIFEEYARLAADILFHEVSTLSWAIKKAQQETQQSLVEGSPPAH